MESLLNQDREKSRIRTDVDPEAYKLFVDLASPYPDRLGILKSFWVLDEKKAYALLQHRLFNTFNLLYTKRKMLGLWEENRKREPSFLELLSGYIRLSATLLPWAAIGLFHKSHREAYNDNDVKVTYALFCCTAVLEFVCLNIVLEGRREVNLGSLVAGLYEQARGNDVLEQSLVGQYTLVGFFARNKRHAGMMCIVNFFNCKDFLDQHWSMKPCNSSFAITELILKYVKKGWEDQMKDADSYWKFNDRRGQWTLQANKCDQYMGCSLRRPFDESVLLWHIATDFCFYYIGASADHPCATAQCNQDDVSGQGHGCAAWCERFPYHERAVRCREMSNYMTYLLFVNPEMLMAGTRRNLFMTANAEVEEILKDDKPSLKKILKGKKPWLQEIERELVQIMIAKVQPTECREEVVACTESPMDADNYPTTQEGFIHDAWKLAKALLDLGDEKMWEVIEGVWVEMLCFSASRSRGYLHAKSMGTGAELLTYVWLLLSHMGMETLPERLQRLELSSGGGNAGAPSTP